jgi:hypothetical protein
MPNLIDLMMGNTPHQRRDKQEALREKFYNERLPQIATEFFQADPADRQAHLGNGLKLMQEAQAAGLSDKQYESILNYLTAPARAKSAERVYGEIDADRKQRGGKMIEENITGRNPYEGADDSLEAFRRQSDFNQDDALKLGRAEAAEGIKIPAHLAETLRVPSQVGLDKETKRLRQIQQSTERTENRVGEMQADELEGLNNYNGYSSDGKTIGPANVARATKGASLAKYLDDQRDRPSEEAVRGSQAQYNRAGIPLRQAQTGAANEEADLRRRTDPNIRRSGGVDRDGNPIETVVETAGPSDPVKLRTTERVIARMAADRGSTDAASLRQIADDLGYELSGDVGVATMKKPGRLYGENEVIDKDSGQPVVTLTGSFRLKPKPQRKTTRKERAPGSGTTSPASSPVSPGFRPKIRPTSGSGFTKKIFVPTRTFNDCPMPTAWRYRNEC